VQPERMKCTMDELTEALRNQRVSRALEIALRDARIRRRFQGLRSTMTVLDACEALSKEFYLSADRIKSIVYSCRRDRVEG